MKYVISFLEAGADIFVLETFPDTQVCLKNGRIYQERVVRKPLLSVQFSLTPTGYSRTGFHYKSDFAGGYPEWTP